jgi:hypothetical protein
LRQSNWFTDDAPAAAQATIMLRGYKIGEYFAPYMSSLEAEEACPSVHDGAPRSLAGSRVCTGESESASARRDFYPTWGGGIHFVVKPAERMLINLEYAQGVEENRGVYLRLGYGW